MEQHITNITTTSPITVFINVVFTFIWSNRPHCRYWNTCC